MQAGAVVKEQGKDNDLVSRIAADELFGVTEEEINEVLKPELYTGRAAIQTERFLNDVVRPVLEKNADLLGAQAEINV